MKYTETNLSFDDFINMLDAHNPDFDKKVFESDMSEFVSCAVDFETLDAGMQDYPTFYYFDDVDGKKYVVEENEGNNCSVIYEVTEIDEENEAPCAIILRDTVGDWDGEACENIVLYGLRANPEPADKNATDVSIWIQYYYYPTTLGAPIDRYLRCVDIDEFSNDYDKYIFDTYADAQAWIDEEERGTYYLSHGESDRPDYIIVD